VRKVGNGCRSSSARGDPGKHWADDHFFVDRGGNGRPNALIRDSSGTRGGGPGSGRVGGAFVGFVVQGEGNNGPITSVSESSARFRCMQTMSLTRSRHGPWPWRFWSLPVLSPLVGGWRGPRLNLGCPVPDNPKAQLPTTSTPLATIDTAYRISQQLSNTPTPSRTRQDRIFFGLHRRLLLPTFFSSSLCPATPSSPRPPRLPLPRSSATVSPTVTSPPFVPGAKSGRPLSIPCRRRV
jgi:hypothetical protein